MSNDIQKADQIAFHFYTKLFYVVNQARATAESRTQGKVDKWFNLETPDSDLFTKDAREPYKNISLAPPPPLEIQVVLSVPELSNNQVLVYLKPDSSRARIEPTPRFIVLETYTLSFTPRRSDEDQSIDVALPTIYKHGIPLFRSLYSLLRVLPAWKLHKRLKRRTAAGVGHRHLGIQLRVRSPADRDTLGFDAPNSPFSTQTHAFSSVPHPLGSLALSVRYLSTPEFQLEELESVLSSRFISQDLDGEDFVPTLTKKHQRDSSVSSSTSARSPPKTIARAVSSGHDNVAERFILPARTASTGATAIQPARQLASGDFGGRQDSVARQDFSQSPSSGLAVSRLRRESIGSSPSSSVRDMLHVSSLSSSPSGGMAIRRPNINPVHPFKSNTVLSSSTAGSSSSPSLSIRQGPLAGSPLSTGLAGSTHSRSASVSSSTVAGPTPAATAPLRHPPSPIGFASARPSPPTTFAPSSLSENRRPGTSGSTGSGGSDDRGIGGDGVTIPPRKRYSSSFGHRYVGSVGSTSGDGGGGAGNGGRATPALTTSGYGGSGGGVTGLGIEGVGRERRGSGVSATASYLSTNTDDDDISIFVQDIDSRKPLSGRWKEREDKDRKGVPAAPLGQPHDREVSEATVRQPLGRTSSLASAPSSSRFSTATGSSGNSSGTVTMSSATVTGRSGSSGADPSMSTSPPGLSLSPTRGPMLTSQGDVEERLRKMNETFYKTLEGISGAGTNEAKRRERERRKEREKERERQRERERGSRQNSTEDGPGDGGDGGDDRGGPNLSNINPSPTSGDRGQDDDGGGGRWTPYSLGMGLRRHDNTTSSSSSSGLLGRSDAAASQGSEEVIGRMDMYEGPRSRAYQP